MLSESAVGDDPEQLLSRACAELKKRLSAGENCRVEDFFHSYPSLASSPDYALELVYAEFAARRELGEETDPAEWYARFPQWREQIRRWFQLHGLISESAPPDPITVGQTPATVAPDHPARTHGETVFSGRYEVLEELGQGGMGTVYKVRDTRLGRVVALKRMRAGQFARAEEIERFLREAQAEARLRHPNIVPLFEIAQHDDEHYFTMAFAPGGSLAKNRDRFTADPREAAALVEKIARAVHFAHSNGILHRDLKPGNVLLDENGEPLVTDFGLAKFLDADAELTQAGAIVGTPAYMAPEQAACNGAPVTAQSDVWALGVILYELLTGHRPFPGTAFKELSQRILNRDPLRPCALKPKLDRVLEAVVLKCLEKQLAQRYTSAESLANDLKRWQQGEPTVARPEGLARRIGRSLRHHPFPVAAFVLVGLTIVSIATVLHIMSPDRPLWTIERKLAEGQEVALIGDVGKPLWSSWRLNEAVIDKAAERGGVYSLDTTDHCLRELLPHCPLQRYRLSAEVRHVQGGGVGEVGIYFRHVVFTRDKGEAQYFCLLTFNDQHAWVIHPDQSVSSQVWLYLWHYRDSKGVASSPPLLVKYFQPGTKTVAGSGWRKLAVEVTSQGIECYWEDQLIGKVSSETFQVFDHKLLGRHFEDYSQLMLRPGLGLFVRNGKASFRRVVLGPLK